MCKRRLSIEANQLHQSRAARLPLDPFNADLLRILLQDSHSHAPTPQALLPYWGAFCVVLYQLCWAKTMFELFTKIRFSESSDIEMPSIAPGM